MEKCLLRFTAVAMIFCIASQATTSAYENDGHAQGLETVEIATPVEMEINRLFVKWCG